MQFTHKLTFLLGLAALMPLAGSPAARRFRADI